MNDINGFRQAVFMAAFGDLNALSGVPDNAFKSDTLDAINKITQTYTNREVLKEAKERINQDVKTLETANDFVSVLVAREKKERFSADEQTLSSAKGFATGKDKDVLERAKTYTDAHAKNKNNPHEVTSKQVGLGRLYNISQIGYGLCNTESNMQAKTVVVENIVLIVGARITIKFKNGMATDNPTLNVNGTGAKPITMDSQPVGKGCFDVGGCYEFVYTGDSWECLSGMVRTKAFGENASYIKYRNGLIINYGKVKDGGKVIFGLSYKKSAMVIASRVADSSSDRSSCGVSVRPLDGESGSNIKTGCFFHFSNTENSGHYIAIGF
ncbi:MAG: hypothetical protein ACTTKB_04525 [Treponema sp.]